jgi:hypothetical protein
MAAVAASGIVPEADLDPKAARFGLSNTVLFAEQEPQKTFALLFSKISIKPKISGYLTYLKLLNRLGISPIRKIDSSRPNVNYFPIFL